MMARKNHRTKRQPRRRDRAQQPRNFTQLLESLNEDTFSIQELREVWLLPLEI